MIIQNNQQTRRKEVEERDKQLLKMIRKHPEEGMGLLIDEYGGAIKTICSNVLHNYDADIVQDAMQETVIRLWQKLSQRFQVKKNLKAYIYQTARNCALDYLRKYQKHSESDFEGVEDMMQDVSADVEREFSKKHNEWIVHEVIKEKSKNKTWYAFKNQKIKKNDFYARLIKVDQTIKKNFFVNDVEKYSEAEISGNKVLILSMNNIDGKKDHKVYIFYEKEGYILEIPSCELSKNQILNAVKNITVQECSKKDADKAISLTKYLKEQKGIKENQNLLSKQNVAKKQEVSKGYGDGITYQIQKIKVCDSVKGLSSENKKWRNNNAQSQLRKITDKKGKLESYQRKTIIYGDGFHAPEQRIGKTQTMN